METTVTRKTPMFIGEYQHSMDSKGRIALPVKFRQALSDKAVITRGLDSCLVIYPEREWQILAERIASLPLSQANTRAFSRLMLAGAMELQADRQGRVMVPEYLRTYANLKKQVVVVGLLNRMEVWDALAWKSYRSATEENSSTIAEALQNLGV